MLAACIGAYLAVMIAVGLVASRRVHGAADYAVARGRFGGGVVAATVFATWFGAETVLGIPAVFMKEGVGGLAADPFAAVGCLVLVALVFARPLFRLHGLTLGDFFRDRFDRRCEMLLSACIAFSYLGWVAAQLVALGVVFATLTGGAIDVRTGAVVGAAIVLVYTLWGGMWSVALTDLVQAIVIVLGLAWVGYVISGLAGGADRVVASAVSAGRLRFAPPTDVRGLLGLTSASFIVLLGSVPQQDVLQRIRSARTEGAAVAGTLLGGVAYFAVACVPIFLVSAAALIDPPMVGRLLDGDSQMILPTLVLERMPVALQALFFGALLSAIFSTASAALLAPAVTVAGNLVRPLLRDAGDRTLLRAMRLTVLILAGVVTAMAVLSRQSIYDLVNNSGKVVLAAAFVPLAAGLFWRRATARGAWWSAVGGLATWIGCEALAPEAALPPALAGLLASAVAMVAGSLRDPASSGPPSRP
ncbi:MAG TPA: sodium:solute symporter family protein [Usitatibacter sp.]|nr:sodium:solute symporter family protein [Usitatibacter sp.]